MAIVGDGFFDEFFVTWLGHAALLALRLLPAVALFASLAASRLVLFGPALLSVLLAAALVPIVPAASTLAGPLNTPGAGWAGAAWLGWAGRNAWVGVALALILLAPLVSMAWLGASLGAVVGMGPDREGQESPLSHLYGALAIALCFALGGHRVAVETLWSSLRVVPLSGPLGPGVSLGPALARTLGGALGTAIGWALLWSAPLWVSMWLLDGLLALWGRFVQRASTGAWAAPVRVAASLALLVAGGAFAAEAFPDALLAAQRMAAGLFP